MPNHPHDAKPAAVTLRAREPGDWQQFADLMDLPRVRWGTLRLPFASREQWRKAMETPVEGRTDIVAVLDGRIVGHIGLIQNRGRRSHVGEVYMAVHDEHCGRGIGSTLVAALIDAVDNWLNLRRLELTVYVDNEPAIRLYKKFGFEAEGTRRAEAFRDGEFVDALMMARVRLGQR
jgi:putative acetyltransferase